MVSSNAQAIGKHHKTPGKSVALNDFNVHETDEAAEAAMNKQLVSQESEYDRLVR